ncbi:hypothetical protein NL676_036943 [Syzygium grande]|nr:hypothetical protein NL676_036943 [Syzygium grande]
MCGSSASGSFLGDACDNLRRSKRHGLDSNPATSSHMCAQEEEGRKKPLDRRRSSIRGEVLTREGSCARARMSPEIVERKRKSRSRREGSMSVAETLAKWKQYNDQLDSQTNGGKPVPTTPVGTTANTAGTPSTGYSAGTTLSTGYSAGTPSETTTSSSQSELTCGPEVKDGDREGESNADGGEMELKSKSNVDFDWLSDYTVDELFDVDELIWALENDPKFSTDVKMEQ